MLLGLAIDLRNTALLVALVAGVADAQLGYSVIDEGVQPFVSIASPANRLVAVSSCDECVEEVLLPFDFPWFGERLVNRVTVTSNGQINMDARLDPECCDPVIGGIPDPTDQNHDAVFLVKEDLNPTAGGGIHATTIGMAPNRRWVLELSNLKFWLADGRADAQLELNEADGSIVMHFGPAGDLGGHSFSAGVESSGGLAGSPAVAGSFFDAGGRATSAWPASRRVRFVPPSIPDLLITAIRPSMTALSPGAMVDIEVDIQKLGVGSVPVVRVDLFVNPPSPPTSGDLSTEFRMVALTAEPGATAIASFDSLSSAVPATWEIYAIVNSDLGATELDTTNDVFGVARVFFAGVLPLPFHDGFDSGLMWVLDPAMPAGGAVTPCAGSVPCEHARAAIDPARQSTLAPGTAALVLDCDSSNDWLGLAAPPIAEDPLSWELPRPMGMPSHTGRALIRLDTSSVARLSLEFDLAFLVDLPTDQQLVIEVDDGRGWTVFAGPGASAGVAGDIYRPACPTPGGCSGAATPWSRESVDLSAVATGGEIVLSLRWLVRQSATGSSATAALVDEVRVTGDPTGLRLRKELPPAARVVDAGSVIENALPFIASAVGEAHSITAFTFSARGGLDDAVELGAVELFRDEDGSRTWTPADTFLAGGVFSVDDGDLLLVLPAPESLPPGGSERYVVTTGLLASALSGADVTLAVSQVEVSGGVGQPADVGGLPVAGDRLIVAEQRIDLSTSPFAPPQPVVRRPDSADVVTGAWRISSAGAEGELRAITVTATGDGDDALGLTNIRLLRELPGSIDGRISAGETAIAAAGGYPADNGALTLSLTPPVWLAPGETLDLLYVVDVTAAAAAGGATHLFQALVPAAAAVDSDAGTITIPPAGLSARLLAIDGCPLSRCGDCDVDGDVDIVDALTAAQHAVGLVVLADNPFANCNVEGEVEPSALAAVTVTDALVIARSAAGLPASLSCC